MKRGVIWIVLTLFMVTSLTLASCSSSTTASMTATTAAPISSTTTTTTTPTVAAPITSTSVLFNTPTISATATTYTGNWWDNLGIPQYGGKTTVRSAKDLTNYDPYNSLQSASIMSAWLTCLYVNDWTLSPAVYDWKEGLKPPQYVVGAVVASWEFTDLNTYVAKIRQNIYWQNISPVNGRQFTAADVVYHFDRLCGLGGGFTTPSPYISQQLRDLTSITATDKFTVVLKWHTPNPNLDMVTLPSTGNLLFIEAPETVQQWGDLNDWRHSVSDGPFILQDVVSGASDTLIKNPNYWGFDERYPQNKLPYIDELSVLIIPSDATAMAAMRVGKIDELDGLTQLNAQAMQKTNPETFQVSCPNMAAGTVDPRNDKAPFTDIKVREAMQMSIDLPTLASTYYSGTCDPWPSTLTSNYLAGMGFPYPQWPQDLKDQYAYNPTQAKALLAAAGYPSGFKTDVVADASADLNLLQIVQSYFAAVGINMSINVMDSASFTSYVYVGHSQNQLAYRFAGYTPLGITNSPLTHCTQLITGGAANYEMVSDPNYDALANKVIAATTQDGYLQAVEDLNKLVAQQHYAISLLSTNTFSVYQPWRKGYTGQWGENYTTGFGNLGFYESRFWIDQKLKTSLGH